MQSLTMGSDSVGLRKTTGLGGGRKVLTTRKQEHYGV